ncbi:MAG TPA: TasA family protein [Halococcus sp.]|nr:TasA family protein [Halococcus sp.]
MSDDYDGTRLTRRRLLGGVATMGVAAAIGGVGTMARFRDEESSTDNSVQAGTFDLKLGDNNQGFGDGVSGSWTFSNAKPGDEFNGVVYLENTGSVPADHVELRFDYDEIEASGNGADEGDTQPNSAVGMAKQFEILQMEYPWGASILDDLTDANGNGIIDLDDLTQPANAAALDNLTPPPPAGDGFRNLNIRFRFADDSQFTGGSNNDVQGDKLTFTVTFALHQTSSQDI